MNILLVMIPLSVLLALGAGIAFFWAVDHDQFDDLDTPSLLPLLDDPRADEPARDEGRECQESDEPQYPSFRRKPESICFRESAIKMDDQPFGLLKSASGLRRDDDNTEHRIGTREEPRA